MNQKTLSPRKLDVKCKNCQQLIFWDKEYANWYHLFEGHPQKRCILPPQIAEPLYRGDAHEIRQGYVVTIRDTRGNNNHLITHRFTNTDEIARFIDAPNATVYEIIKRPYVPE